MAGTEGNIAQKAVETAAKAGAHGGGEGGLAIDPMHQFKVEWLTHWNIGGFDISFTNASLWMVIAVCVASLVLLAGSTKLVPGRLQSVGDLA